MKYEDGWRVIAGIKVFEIDADGTWQASIGDGRVLVDTVNGTVTIDHGPCTSDLEYVRRPDGIVLYEGDVPVFRLPRFKRDGKEHWFDNVLKDHRIRIDEDDNVFIEEVEIVRAPYKRPFHP